MSEDLIKQLEEQAKKVMASTIYPQIHLPTPVITTPVSTQRTIDISHEVITEKLYNVYNTVGAVVQVNKNILNSHYILCKDNSYIYHTSVEYINRNYYNPFTENIIKDSYGYFYIEKYTDTWNYLIKFISDGDLNGSEIVSVDFINYYNEEEHPYDDDDNPLEIVNIRDNVYVREEQLAEYNYEIRNGSIVRRGKPEEFRKELFEKYPFFEATLNGLYRDHWDISYHRAFSKHCLIIKFDEFTISNSNGQTHVIKDLYVLLPINKTSDNKISFTGGMYGGRGLVSNVEREAQYKHSHLNDSWNKVSHFCLGSGPISSYMVKFNLTPDENTLFSVLYNVKIYVEWESLEGTPYKYMKNLGKSEVTESESISLSLVDTFKSYIKKYKLPLKMINQGKGNKLILDESIIEVQLLDFVGTHISTTGGRVYRNKATGKCFREGNVKTINEKSNDILLTYKGEDIYSTVYNLTNFNIEDTEYVVHPYATKKFIEYALRRIGDYYFKKISGTDPRKSSYYNI